MEEASERAALDQRRALRRHAFVVEGRGVRPDLEAAVVDQREHPRADLLTDELGEEGTSLLHGLRGERPGEHTEEARRRVRIEDDRDASRRRLRRSEEPRGALRGGRAAVRPVELSDLPGEPEVEAGLRLVSLLRERGDDAPAIGPRRVLGDPGAGDDDGPRDRVAVDDVVRLRHARIGRRRDAFEVECEGDLPVGLEGGLLVAEDARHRLRGARERQDVELVRHPERDVLPRLRDRRAHLVEGGIRGVRVSELAARDDANTDPARLRERQALHLTLSGANLRVARLRAVRFDGLVALGRGDRGLAELQEVRRLRHRCPPPSCA